MNLPPPPAGNLPGPPPLPLPPSLPGAPTTTPPQSIQPIPQTISTTTTTTASTTLADTTTIKQESELKQDSPRLTALKKRIARDIKMHSDPLRYPIYARRWNFETAPLKVFNKNKNHLLSQYLR